MATTNRRDFSKLTAAAFGGCAVSGVQAVANESSSFEIQKFEGLIGSQFSVTDAQKKLHVLVLREVLNHHSERDADRPTSLHRQQSFSLIFEPAELNFDSSSVCHVKHPKIPSCDLLFSEVRHEKDLEVAFG